MSLTPSRHCASAASPDTTQVRRKKATWFWSVALITSVFPTIARAEKTAEVGDIAALQRELKELTRKNQEQIEALKRQLRDLSAHLAERRAAPRPAAVASIKPKSAPFASPLAATPRLPPKLYNLPGRSTLAPYTETGSGPPGAAPVKPAAPVTSGGNRVTLSLSGQINRALLYGNDGDASKVRQVDNSNSSSRIRIVGEAHPTANTVAGINLETQITPNSSANETLTQNLPQSASNVTFTIRQAELYAGNPRYGEVRLGFGSTASYLTSQVDLSGTAIASYVNVADFDGGFAFRQTAAARVPGGAKGSFVLSPVGAYGPAVGSVFNYFDGLGRDDRIRYDTPVWEGFQLSISAVDGGAFDFGLRFAREYHGFRIAGGFGGAFATARNHAEPGAYGYAGVPAGAGGISLGGTNSAPNTPTTADVTADGSNQFDGSISVLFDNGFNATLAAGTREPDYRDPTGAKLSPTLLFGKLGYQHRFLPIGVSAFSADYAQNDDLIFARDRARAWGVAAVQNIDRFGMEVYLAARYQTLDRTFAKYHPIIAVLFGSRVRF